MRSNTIALLVLSLLLTAGLALLVPETAPLARALAAVPAIGAVTGAVFLLLRDEISYQRQLDRDRSSNTFHVAAQSHMAKVLFDKHVMFAEAYASAAREVVGRLFREGPTPKMRDIEPLSRVRQEHGIWVSASLATQLDKFELQFIEIGNAMALWEDNNTRSRLPPDHLDRAFDAFHDITGLTRADVDKPSPTGRAHSIQIMMTWLQGLLGVEQLTSARERAVADASTSLPPIHARDNG